MATTGNKPDETGFPSLSWEEEELATRPLPLHELPAEVGIEQAMAVIDRHHARIAKAIRIFWGSRDCVEYIQKLVMSGGDGFGNTRVGFKPEVVSAMLSLISMHQREFRVDSRSGSL